MSYNDGEVVWVKWGNVWWPGEVWSSSRVPEDIMTSLRKPVMVFVKFFQEDSFEFVRNHNNVMKYDCEKKLDFIKKGMDKHRSNSKVMANFPADVVRAEQLTKGNVNILSTLDTPSKQRPGSSQMKLEKSSPVVPPPVVASKPAGSYSSSTKVQSVSSPAPKSDKKFTCTMCDFSTDRINLLMFHIKNHSSTFVPRTNDSPTVIPKKVPKSPAKKLVSKNDTIADDVRKIQESLKKEIKTPAKKSREPAKPSSAAKTRLLRKVETVETLPKEEVAKVEEKPKPANELKNELLADWMDDDEDEVVEPETVPEPPKISPKTSPKPDKVEETAKPSIRNIPKKQRVSEVYVKSDKAEEPQITLKQEISKQADQKLVDNSDSSRRGSKANKRKHTTDMMSEPEPKKHLEENDEGLLMATAELLNETEVPKMEMESGQVPSTFHKSNDIDKRNLPPKERNKRIFRDHKSRESPPETIETAFKSENNGSMTQVTASPLQNELMLPHKKKQSSRLLTIEIPTPVCEVRNDQDSVVSEPPLTKTRRLSEVTETEQNSHAPLTTNVQPETVQSPLRDQNDEDKESESVPTSNFIVSPLKRRTSQQLAPEVDDEEIYSKPKKLHESNSEPTSIVAGANETICITSKGQISVSKDSVKTTEANSVIVQSQVIITEATHQTSDTSPTKSQTSSPLKHSSQAVKNALKFPAEELLEMKKQGLVTVGDDKKNKFTKKGRKIFKKMKETVIEATEPEPQKIPELMEKDKIEVAATEEDFALKPDHDDEKPATLDDEQSKVTESIETPATVEERTNNNDIQKETSPAKEVFESPETVENGKEADGEPEVSVEDASSGGAGLIALQAENFGGPQNCFYLCRQVEDRYEPVDNQILVLNAQNSLVPYEGDIVMEDALAPTDGLVGYPQLSPNSKIIINTPNGQKIELNHMAILALQEQADENGIASIEASGEQLELNINWILETISAQQETNEGDALIPGPMLIDGDGALMPVETHHSATQVSETLSKPIMSTTVAPEITSTKAAISETVTKNLNIEDSLTLIGVNTQPTRSNVPKSLELPITITNPTIAETVNHRKLANASVLEQSQAEVTAVESESLVIQPSVDNGSRE